MKRNNQKQRAAVKAALIVERTNLFMRTIIVINGKGGIGKDTLISAVEKQASYSVSNVSSITPIRKKCEEYDKNPKDNAYRKLLATLKAAYDEYETSVNGISFTQKYLLKETKMFVKFYGEDDLLFVHIREPQNIAAYIDAAKKEYPFVKIKTLLVSSDRAKEDYGNDADNLVDNYDYTHYFISNGDKDTDAKRFVEFIEGIRAENG